MRAWRCRGADSQPQLEHLDADRPGPGEMLVEVRACGLNFADLLMIRGQYQETPTHPFTLGMEISGLVHAVGDGVEVATGTRVAAFPGQGGLADYAIVSADRAVTLPEGMGYDSAAALQIAYGTSHLALDHRARLRPGETLLVLGATGGVGLTAVELGKLMGARVIAVARGAEKEDIARNAGADIYLDSETADLRAEVKALGGADVVYDPVGGALGEAAFRACNPEARYLLIGFASGSTPAIKPNHMLVKNIDLIGFYWGAYFKFRPEVLTRSLATLLDWHAQGRIHPHISHRLPLEQAMEGLYLLRDRAASGKVIIQP
ncbi:NADPH:quinone oxidoreductase family protein [Pseudooceanicola marinus]|uniref:NADPH:quinone oxidoreductase family protein n=1 Tax=Pseudooceanicola marinus TaxID=396013 RepID=UPI001CD3B69E|nr:NADPH:quinone oxidoreductase family protein [Pseudooceanicola marinus]MCA1337312.1 NADPH:quinone oxidoreductase family protein [Pseudooceanicola marinus]